MVGVGSVSDVRDARQSIVDALRTAGVDAYALAPGRSKPNIVVVEPGNPYIEGAEVKTFQTRTVGEGFTVRYDLAVVGKTQSTANGLTALEDLIEQVIRALDGIVNLETVGNPGFVTPDTATYHAAVVTVTANLIIEEET